MGVRKTQPSAPAARGMAESCSSWAQTATETQVTALDTRRPSSTLDVHLYGNCFPFTTLGTVLYPPWGTRANLPQSLDMGVS